MFLQDLAVLPKSYVASVAGSKSPVISTSPEVASPMSIAALLAPAISPPVTVRSVENLPAPTTSKATPGVAEFIPTLLPK